MEKPVDVVNRYCYASRMTEADGQVITAEASVGVPQRRLGVTVIS